MRLDLERTGGFAGRTARWTLDVDGLGDAERAEVHDLLAQARDWPAAPGPDRFAYLLTADAPGTDPLRVRFVEPLPEPAQRLVQVIRDAGS